MCSSVNNCPLGVVAPDAIYQAIDTMYGSTRPALKMYLVSLFFHLGCLFTTSLLKFVVFML